MSFICIWKVVYFKIFQNSRMVFLSNYDCVFLQKSCVAPVISREGPWKAGTFLFQHAEFKLHGNAYTEFLHDDNYNREEFWIQIIID